MNYLIPANSKKSQLFFGYFNTFDLILFGSGIFITIILLMVLPIEQLKWAIISLVPAGVTGFLVFPIPNYHNVITVIKNIILFYTTRQDFVWKGWCVTSEEKDDE